MKLTKQKIRTMKTKFFEGGATPTTLIINPDDFKDSFLGKTTFGMDVIVTKDVPKDEIYLIDKNQIKILPQTIKKKTLWQKIIERIKGIIRILKYGDIE